MIIPVGKHAPAMGVRVRTAERVPACVSTQRIWNTKRTDLIKAFSTPSISLQMFRVHANDPRLRQSVVERELRPTARQELPTERPPGR